MLSGFLYWVNGIPNDISTSGRLWSSSQDPIYSYAHSLVLSSTNTYTKINSRKPDGFTLRCVVQNHPKSPPLFHLNNFSKVRSALKIPLSCSFSSRALRSLPLSVMLSGNLDWDSGNLVNRGTYGYFWSSTPYAYTSSHYLRFYSTNVYPKSGSGKPYGFTLHCVTQQKKKAPSLRNPALPDELSITSLYRKHQAISTTFFCLSIKSNRLIFLECLN